MSAMWRPLLRHASRRPKPPSLVARGLSSSSGFGASLDSIVKLDKLKDLGGADVMELWQKGLPADSVGACMTVETYTAVRERATQAPIFIYPLDRSTPDEKAFTVLVSQLTLPPPTTASPDLVASFALAEEARTLAQPSPLLTVSFYADLLESHAVVLVRGGLAESPRDGSRLEIAEARRLLQALLRFYSLKDDFEAGPLAFSTGQFGVEEHVDAERDRDAKLRELEASLEEASAEEDGDGDKTTK